MRLEDLSGIAVTFVVLAIILGIGGTILTSVQDDQVADTVAYNATGEGLDSISTFSEWLPTLAIIVVSAVVIGVIGFFYTRR